MAYLLRSKYGYVEVEDTMVATLLLPAVSLLGEGSIAAPTLTLTLNSISLASVSLLGEGSIATPTLTLTPTAFSPLDLGTNLRLWVKKTGVRYQDSARTSLVTAATQPVGSWTDEAVGAAHISQTTSGARPLEPSGRDGAVFDGTKTLNTPAIGAYAADFFVGMVLTPATLSAGYVRFLERVPSGGGVYLGTAGSGNELIAYVNGSASPSTAMSAGAKHAIALTRIGTTASLYLDGSLVQTWTVSSAGIADAATIIGGPDGSGLQYDGVIHEVVIAKDVTGGDVTNLLAHLATV